MSLMNISNADHLFLTLNECEYAGLKLFYYDEFHSLLFNSEKEGELKEDVKFELDRFIYLQDLPSFRKQVVLHGTPFLMAIFFQEKEIRLASVKLAQELFLLQHSEILQLKNERLRKLRIHAEKIAGMNSHQFPTDIEILSAKGELPTYLNKSDFLDVDEKTHLITKELLQKLNEYNPSLFENLTDWGLGLTAQYALLRIHLLKFLAILPSLDHDKTGQEVKRILIESLSRFLKDNQKARSLGKKGQERALPKNLTFSLNVLFVLSKFIPALILTSLVRKSVKLMAKRFIAGETIETADQSLQGLFTTSRDVTLDQLGELVVSEKEADHYCFEVLKLIKGFSLHVKKGELNSAGINRAHVSIKVSALSSDFKPHAFDYTYDLVAPRLKKILLAAKEEDVFINIDAEHYHYRDVVFKVYRKVLLETPELKDFRATGIVVQAYLRDAHEHLQAIIELARERGLMMPVRLVKGAYWDAETVEGSAHSFNAPQFLNKEETDIHFRQLIYKIFEASPALKLCLASHNFSDHAFARALKETRFSTIGEFEHQCLHMTYEALSTALAKMGWPVRNYVPVGSLLVGMAYLVRRIMENSSQVGVLTIMRSHKKGLTLKSPYDIHLEQKRDNKIDRDQLSTKLSEEFFNITPVRLYLDPDRNAVELALNNLVKNQLGKTYQNQFFVNGEMRSIYSSSDPSILVGNIQFANLQDAEKALVTIEQSYLEGTWANQSFSYRVATLIKAAEIMLAKRHELAALIVYEAGKAINEALLDVDEAIDFLNFYARTESYLVKNYKGLNSRGPTVVISPWNFPLAIPCGMAVGALVSGNTVILKSAEQTPLIAEKLAEILYAAGIPKKVFIHLPGEGESIGHALVNDERVSTIIFTGSKKVGMLIADIARKRVYQNKLTNQTYLVKAITEMGGKNAVIVTQNAELDETVSGILYSSMGHAGQKCSALSRVIVHEALKDKLLERLKEAMNDLKVGAAFDFKTTMNPIISLEDKNRLQRQVKEACAEAIQYGGLVHINRSMDELPGHAIGPTLIELPIARALDKNSFAQRELFGPVVHVMGFQKIEEAIELFNSTDYALTGGIFSQSQNDIDYISKQLECGNIYINRTITGARVAIEPFGGFKLSGTGPKAGGKHYIISLHQQEQFDDINPADRQGEGDVNHIFLSKPSQLNTVSRIDRMDKFLENFLGNFEAYYRGISGKHKETLRDFHKWMNKNYESFVLKNHKNRTIDGQLSYSEFLLSAEHALLVSVNSRPDIKTLIQVFTCVLSGTGLTVLCRSKDTYLFWSKVEEVFINAGFSKENLAVYHTTESLFKEIINHPKISVLIYDGPLSDYPKDIAGHLITNENDIRVKLILSPRDHLRADDFYHQLMNYVWVRSFAINTMRHGAPLNLEL